MSERNFIGRRNKKKEKKERKKTKIKRIIVHYYMTFVPRTKKM